MRAVLLAVAMIACAVSPPSTALAASVTVETRLDDCDAWTQREPRSLKAYDCYGFVARQRKEWDDAVRRLDDRLALEPDNHWARFELALVEWDRRAPRARDLAIAAAAGFATAGDRAAEARARMSISISWQYVDETRVLEELDRAETLAKALGDRNLLGFLALNRAQAALRRDDYGGARSTYAAAEELAFPDGSSTLHSMILSGEGLVAWKTLRLREALDCYLREAEVCRRDGRAFEEAAALSNVALVAAQWNRREGVPGSEEVRSRFDEALAAARRTGRVDSEAQLLTLRAQIAPREQAVDDARRAGLLLRGAPWSNTALHADLVLAAALERVHGAPVEESTRLRKHALARAIARGNRMEMATAYFFVGEDAWHRGHDDEALAAWEGAIEIHERIRRDQAGLETQSLVFGRSGSTFETVVGRRLTRYLERGDPADLEGAFRTMERGRARQLLDTMEVSGAAASTHDPTQREREVVLGRIAAAQRSLARQGVEPEASRKALDDLQTLERRETELREIIARADPAWGAILQPRIPTLAETREALAEGEVLLAFQLGFIGGPDDPLLAGDYGGSWVLAITRDGVAVSHLPDERALGRAASLLLGAIARADGSEVSFAEALGKDLVSSALPEGSKRPARLILALDGALHRLPFEVLRPSRGGLPLGETFEIVRVPSAATWWRWRTGIEARPSSVLVLADPEFGDDPASAGLRAFTPWSAGLMAGRLPYARREGEMAARLLGGRLLSGKEASESSLKQSAHGGIGLLHIAAHAVVDELRPRRSAVLLAPGSANEDGLLQPLEISSLDLSGATVLLSACSSASGAIEGREGVDGLAAAFLRAGARSVVGGLWALRDADTAAFVEAVVNELARGRTVAAALHGARRALIRRGAPATAWAGLVVVGDGDATVAARPAESASDGRVAAVATAVAAAVGALALLVWRRMRG